VPEQEDKFGQEGLYLANFSCFGSEITCAAPGVGIISTVPAGDELAAPYASMCGTSMASPAACAAVAVLLSQDPDYPRMPRDETRAEMARNILRRNCRDIGLDPHYQGSGVPDARS
jgi:subtilisin family serine protease